MTCYKRSSGHSPFWRWDTLEEKEAAAEAELASDSDNESTHEKEPHIYVDMGLDYGNDDDSEDEDDEPHIYVDTGYIATLKSDACVQTEQICSEVGIQTVMGLLDMRVVTVDIAHAATQVSADLAPPLLPHHSDDEAEVSSGSGSENSIGIGESLVPQEISKKEEVNSEEAEESSNEHSRKSTEHDELEEEVCEHGRSMYEACYPCWRREPKQPKQTEISGKGKGKHKDPGKDKINPGKGKDPGKDKDYPGKGKDPGKDKDNPGKGKKQTEGKTLGKGKGEGKDKSKKPKKKKKKPG